MKRAGISIQDFEWENDTEKYLNFVSDGQWRTKHEFLVEFEKELKQYPISCLKNIVHIKGLPADAAIDGPTNYLTDQEIIEILQTLKKQKINVYSTNKNPDKMNLSDKMIKLSQQKFNDEETFRSVWNILTDFNKSIDISQYIENHKKYRNSEKRWDFYIR